MANPQIHIIEMKEKGLHIFNMIATRGRITDMANRPVTWQTIQNTIVTKDLTHQTVTAMVIQSLAGTRYNPSPFLATVLETMETKVGHMASFGMVPNPEHPTFFINSAHFLISLILPYRLPWHHLDRV